MSEYVVAVCREHRAVSRVIGGRQLGGWFANDDGELVDFLEAHGACSGLEIVSEHDGRAEQYDVVPTTT